LILFNGHPGSSLEIVEIVGIGLVPVAAFALFPMVMFKPQLRTLMVDEDGITTSIGRHSGTVDWGQISSVENDGDSLIIQRSNLNSFIVPARAFETSDAKSEFCEFIEARARANDS
jgi:hypothetical protein